MIDSAIVFTYTRPAPGREDLALEAFTKGLAFFGAAAHEGKCEDPLTFMGMSGQSLIIVPGAYEELFLLIRSDEFRELITKAIFAAPDLGYEIGPYGQGVQDYMARWAKVGSELAFM